MTCEYYNNGPHIPTILIDGMLSPKPEKDWGDVNKRLAQLNAKVMKVLYYPLDTNEFNTISIHMSIKKIWNRLEVIYEGTNKVKESKIMYLYINMNY